MLTTRRGACRGLLSFASTTLILSLVNVQADKVGTPNVVVGMALFVGGLAQLLAGQWEFAAGNTLGATGECSSLLFHSPSQRKSDCAKPPANRLSGLDNLCRKRILEPPVSHELAHKRDQLARHAQGVIIPPRG